MMTVADAAPAARGRPADPHLEGRFVDAALEILTARGYRALTTAAVAQTVGASTASLYRRWPSKRALVADVARTLARGALDDLDTGTVAGDLRELITRKRRLFDRVGTALIALLAESAHDAQLREILQQDVLHEVTAQLHDILARAVAREEIPEPAPQTAATLALVLTGTALMQHALAPGASPVPAVEAEVEMITGLLGIDRPAASVSPGS